MVKIWQLTRGRAARTSRRHDLVILDAPATGHALGMLRSPDTFGAIARVGPIAKQTAQVSAAARRPGAKRLSGGRPRQRDGRHRDAGAAVGSPRRARKRARRGDRQRPACPRRFSAGEMEQIQALAPASNGRGGSAKNATVIAAAVHAANEVHDRARFQHGQVARLRRRGLSVLSVPFVWGGALDLEGLRGIASRLERGLEVDSNDLDQRPVPLVDSQPVQQRIVRSPVAPHPHGQVEMDAVPQRAFQLLARGRADRLDHAPVGADQDALLGVALDPYQRPDPCHAPHAGVRPPRPPPQRRGAPRGRCA